MKLYLVLLFGFVVSSVALCQGQILKGVVIDDANRAPIDFATVVVQSCIDSSYIDYGMTNSDGSFQFDLSADLDSVLLIVSKLGLQAYEQKIRLNKTTLTVKVIMYQQAIKLDNVIIKAQGSGIKINKDTTLIDAKRFATGDERVMEDLIRKLPGIEVGENGKIKYLGKDITKVLFDGDNLLGSNYTTGVKNISVKVIDKVEIIDHYLDNPLFKGIMASNEMVLNIKVDEAFKGDISGNASLGTGYGEDLKYAGGVNLFGIMKKLKLFTLNGIENTKSSADDFNPLYLFAKNESKFSKDAFDESTSLINRTQSQASAFLSSKYFIRGRDYINDVNMIKNLNKNHKLVINGKYNVRNDGSDEYNTYNYFQNTDTLTILSSDGLNARMRNFNISIGSEVIDLSRNYSLTSEVMVYNNKNTFRQSLVRNNADLTTDQSFVPEYLKVKSEFNKRIDGGILQVFAEFQKRQSNEEGTYFNPLLVSEFGTADVRQRIDNDLTSGQFYVKYMNRKRWFFDLQLGVQSYQSDITTSLSQSSSASKDFSANANHRRDMDYFLNFIRKGIIKDITYGLKTGLIYSKVKSGLGTDFLLPTVDLTLDYEIQNLWNIRFVSTLNQKLQPIENNLLNFYMQDFQTKFFGIQDIEKSTFHESKFLLSHKDPYKGFYFNLNAGYKNSGNIVGNNFEFDNSQIFSTRLFVPVNQNVKYAGTNFNYISVLLKSRLAGSINYSAQNNVNRVNDIQRDVNLKILATTLEYGTAYKVFNFSINYSNILSKIRIEGNANIQDFSQNKLFLKLTLDHKKILSFQHVLNYNSFNSNGVINKFVSTEFFVKYKINKHNLNYIDLNIINPMNAKNYQTNNITDYYTSQYLVNAVQRFFLVTVNFNI